MRAHHSMLSTTLAYKVLDLARWAPSGDNRQPWRFELRGPESFVVRVEEDYDDPIYDLDEHALWMSMGALLENIAIAATGLGTDAEIRTITDTGGRHPAFAVRLVPDARIGRDRLHRFIQTRSVYRGAMHSRPLSAYEKQALADSLGGGYEVIWFEGLSSKWRVARLLSTAGKLRLTLPEARATHRAIIEWNARFSDTRIPDRALGVSWPTRVMMQWALKRDRRIEILNRYLAGTWLPRLEMDLAPALRCGAHFLLLAPAVLQTADDLVRAGQAMQRFWLTATALGLMVQPQSAPLIFGRYADKSLRFSDTPACLALAAKLRRGLDTLFGTDAAARGFFLGRIGAGEPCEARSTREPVENKLIEARLL